MQLRLRNKKVVIVVAATVLGGGFMSRGFLEKIPDNLGLLNGRLRPCPESPNCISSESTNPKQSIEPLRYETSMAEARTKLQRLVESMNRTTVLAETSNYLHVAFRVPLTGFVDDVEFRFDEGQKVIHMRSASRTGYWDLGVNRRRLVTIREAWDKNSKKLI